MNAHRVVEEPQQVPNSVLITEALRQEIVQLKMRIAQIQSDLQNT